MSNKASSYWLCSVLRGKIVSAASSTVFAAPEPTSASQSSEW